MKGLFQELRKRKVTRVAIAYLVFSWVVLQIADIILPALGLPDWTVTVTLALLVAGFPVALVLSWIFDITPQGIERTDMQSLAVLPFTDISAERDQEHFCDGLTEELMQAMTRIPNLRLASRTSSFAFKDKDTELSEVAEKLGVDHVLEGSVRKDSGKARISARLTELSSDTVIWAASYDRKLCDLLAVQDDIANCIAEALELKLGQRDSSAPSTNDPRAFEIYLRGRGHAITNRKDDLKRAEELFLRAIEIDPAFTQAWVQLAEVTAIQAIFLNAGEEAKALSARAGEKAMELAPNEGSSYMAYGFGQLACNCYEDAEQAFLKAYELDSSLVRAWHYLARTAHHQGQTEKERDYFARATELDEDDWESPVLVMALHEKLGNERRAKKAARISVKRIECHLRDYPDNPRAYYLGVGALWKLNQQDKAREWAEKALQLAPDDPPTHYNLACFYARAGDVEKSLDLLESSITSRSWIENDPDLDSIRSHPRYRQFVAGLAD